MAKYEEKFIVIHNKHINELPLQVKDDFIQALVKIREYLPENKYLVCNQDEPYADNVLEIILVGEDAKKAPSKWCWMMDYCKRERIPPAQAWAWKRALVSYNKHIA